MELHSVIDTIAHLDPSASALWFEGRWFTWQELNELGDATLELLTAGGVLPDESIGVVVRNNAATVAVLLGALRARRPVLMFSPLLPDRALADDVGATRPAALVASDADWQRRGLLAALQQVGTLGIELDSTMKVHAVAGTTRRRGVGAARTDRTPSDRRGGLRPGAALAAACAPR